MLFCRICIRPTNGPVSVPCWIVSPETHQIYDDPKKGTSTQTHRISHRIHIAHDIMKERQKEIQLNEQYSIVSYCVIVVIAYAAVMQTPYTDTHRLCCWPLHRFLFVFVVAGFFIVWPLGRETKKHIDCRRRHRRPRCLCHHRHHLRLGSVCQRDNVCNSHSLRTRNAY